MVQNGTRQNPKTTGRSAYSSCHRSDGCRLRSRIEPPEMPLIMILYGKQSISLLASLGRLALLSASGTSPTLLLKHTKIIYVSTHRLALASTNRIRSSNLFKYCKLIISLILLITIDILVAAALSP
jgi:hypothetical protein